MLVRSMVLDNGRFLTQELANITQMLEEHFRYALSANKIVTNSLNIWLDDGNKVAPEKLDEITSIEEKADKLKRSILNELAKANSLIQREDLVRLVHSNDKLIDGAEIACYHLAAVAGKWGPSDKLKKIVSNIAEKIIATVTEQKEGVRFLSINMEKSMEKANQICSIEKEIDILQREAISLLYPEELDLSILLRFRDFLNTLEEIANLSEDAAITIRSLSLTLRT